MSAVLEERAGNSLRPAATLAATGSREVRARTVTLALMPALVLAMVAALLTGAVETGPRDLLALLSGASGDAWTRQVLLEIRLPRVLLGALVGAALGASGAALQGLFRNPLADPGLIGVSAGAALAAVAVIVLGGTALAPLTVWLGPAALPVAAFVGGLITTLVVYRLASYQGHTSVATLLLAGIAINAIAGAGTGLLVYVADDQQLRTLTFWNMGSLARAEWPALAVGLAMILASFLALPLVARALNGMMLGEQVARHLGFSIHRLKLLVIVMAALAVGTAVALAGIIGFVGLVVPHILRLAIGPDHRYLLPAAALGGALLLVLADAVARTIVAPAELPIGLLTAVVGGPFFLWLLMRMRGQLG